MRTFIAITLPKETKASLSAAMNRLAPVATDVTWCSANQLHLTFAFLGEISPALLPHLTVAMKRVCEPLHAVPCHAYGFGFFGNRRNPKVIWAGVNLSPEMERLYSVLWQELKRFGFSSDEELFRPHITLGRCKERARNQSLIAAMDDDPDVDFGQWMATDITLYESRLTSKGAHYAPLNKFHLGGTP